MFELKSKDSLLSLTTPKIMGILNVTPDSFSDGGKFSSFEQACYHGDKMVQDGASIIDVGGESTRPGASPVSLSEELERVIPVINYLSRCHGVWISIDSGKPEVMAAAVKAGAHLINDIRALQEPGAIAMAASLQVPVCLMHMQGQPKSMQHKPYYEDVVAEVIEFFKQRIDACVRGGIPRENLIIDPGFGFGKNQQHNYELLANLNHLSQLGLPILTGLSRKTMLGQVTGNVTDERVAASLAGALLCVTKGASIIRVHDVRSSWDTLKVWQETQLYTG